MRRVVLGHSAIQTAQHYQRLESSEIMKGGRNPEPAERGSTRSKLKIVGGKK